MMRTIRLTILRSLCVAAVVCYVINAPVYGQGVEYIRTDFANASPLDWAMLDDHSVQIDLLYDHERSSPNRAAGHWYFRVDAAPHSKVQLRLNRFDNIWNSRSSIPVSDATITFISDDDIHWSAIETEFDAVNRQLSFELTIPASGFLWVARLPPYRISDLESFLDRIIDHPLVEVETIGTTVGGQSLEIVQVGHASAPYHVFFRARAHPWEPGGNWVVEGLIDQLLGSKNGKYDDLCVHVLPMANKDGVRNGMTRFNGMGKDLNRDWNAPADLVLCPENAALEGWLESRLASGKRIDLAFELHNDQNGKLHISASDDPAYQGYQNRMLRLEGLMRQHSWFREGISESSLSTSTTLPHGFVTRYGIDAVVHELNSDWIEGLQQPPSAENWKLYGQQMCDVLVAYFQAQAGAIDQ